MNEDQMEALKLLGAATRGRYQIYEIAGPQNGKLRARIMTLLCGEKCPIAKSGVTRLRSTFYALAAVTGGCLAAKEDNFIEWAVAAVQS